MQVQWPTPLNHPLMIKQKVTGKGLELKNIRMTSNNQRLGSCGRQQSKVQMLLPHLWCALHKFHMTDGQNMHNQIEFIVLFASLGLAEQLVELVESKPGGKAKFDYIF